MNKYCYIISDTPSVAFLTLDDAIDYDMRHNPEYHSTKEQSFWRSENSIQEQRIDDLTESQHNFLFNFNEKI